MTFDYSSWLGLSRYSNQLCRVPAAFRVKDTSGHQQRRRRTGRAAVGWGASTSGPRRRATRGSSRPCWGHPPQVSQLITTSIITSVAMVGVCPPRGCLLSARASPTSVPARRISRALVNTRQICPHSLASAFEPSAQACDHDATRYC